jgi:YfiH family protein
LSYKITGKEGAQYLRVPDLEVPGIRHFFTTRTMPGDHPVPFGRQEVFVMVKQVHGDNILIIDKTAEDVSTFTKDAMQKTCDAIITNQKEIGIGVVTADCLPALLYDPARSVIAAVHAGWRGTLQRILPKVVCQMVSLFECKAKDILVGMGPAIGPCCYTVGKAVTEPLKSAHPDWEKYLTPSEDGKARLDLTALNSRQIEDAGILKKNIFSVRLCTACNDGLFFSYRRDGVGTGRMTSGIMML